MKALLSFIFSICTIHFCYSQLPMVDFDAPVVKETSAVNRQQLYKNLVSGINRNLCASVSDSNEENWMDAFYSIELLRYRSPWLESKLHESFAGIENRSGAFQRALMEMIYDAYPTQFTNQARMLLDVTEDAKCFAICAEYLLKITDDGYVVNKILERRNQFPQNPVINALYSHISNAKQLLPPLHDLLYHQFFPGCKVVFSFQRKNRDFPGIALVRDSAGNFLRDDKGQVFFVPQLARSMTNLPGYISNGNTPQGIFRMYGLDVSRSIFIGPTPNIQLTMPGEAGVHHFLNDSTVTGTTWSIETYRDMLPQSWKPFTPFYHTYFAGMAGRNEIIAHGTTVDPSYYKNTAYYPLTPTLGCLCTKEIWHEHSGRRVYSDQQKLVDALQKAGGANGYLIVIELDDEQRKVDIADIISYLK